MDINNILKKASRLKEKAHIISLINKQLPPILLHINSEIDNAHSIFKDEIYVNLPMNFDCPRHVSNKIFQTNIYYKIIQLLEDKGYVVKMKLTKSKTILYVSWKINIDNKTIETMEQKIRSIKFE